MKERTADATAAAAGFRRHAAFAINDVSERLIPAMLRQRCIMEFVTADMSASRTEDAAAQ